MTIYQAITTVLSHLPVPYGNQYRKFFHKSNVPFCVISFEGKIVLLNRAFADKLGYTVKELKGDRFMRHVYHGDHGKTMDEYEVLKSGGVTTGFNNSYVSKTGKLVSMTWYCTSNGFIYCVSPE